MSPGVTSRRVGSTWLRLSRSQVLLLCLRRSPRRCSRGLWPPRVLASWAIRCPYSVVFSRGWVRLTRVINAKLVLGLPVSLMLWPLAPKRPSP